VIPEFDGVTVISGERIVYDFKTFPHGWHAHVWSEDGIYPESVGRARESIEAGGTGVLDLDTDREPDDGDTDDLTDWFTLRVRPVTCGLCGTVLEYAEVTRKERHVIVVWPSRDDPNMLKAARRFVEQRPGGFAEVVEFERGMGPCMSYYQLVSEGSVVPG
jgi:hypothetical protein